MYIYFKLHPTGLASDSLIDETTHGVRVLFIVGKKVLPGMNIGHDFGLRRFRLMVSKSLSVRPHERRAYSFTPPYRSPSIFMNACIVSSLSQ